MWFGKSKDEEPKIEKAILAPLPEKVVKPVKQTLVSPIPSNAKVKASLDFDVPVQISGQIEGEIFSASTITVAKDGTINGKVEADCFEIYGCATGQLKARSKLVLHEGSTVSAEIETPELEVKEGACLNGSCSVVHE